MCADWLRLRRNSSSVGNPYRSVRVGAALPGGAGVKESIKRRFMAKSVTLNWASGCWLWDGAKNNQGYGVMNVGAHRVQTAHRLAWEIARGPIPEGQCVLHRCDNPSCINPAHLFLGTQKDNAEDREQKGRSPLGEARPNSKLTVAAVAEIRRIAAEGGMSLRGLGRRYGVCLATIRQVLTGRTWTHV